MEEQVKDLQKAIKKLTGELKVAKKKPTTKNKKTSTSKKNACKEIQVSSDIVTLKENIDLKLVVDKQQNNLNILLKEVESK